MTEQRLAGAAPPVLTPADADAGVRGVARGGLANLIGAAFAGLSGFAVAWIVTHALDASEAGAFFASTAAFVLIGTVAKLGTQTSLVYFPARLRTGNDIPALRRCLRAALVPVTVSAAILGAAMWVFASRIAELAARNGQVEYAHQLRVLAIFLPASALSDALLAGTRGFRAMRPTVMLDRILRPALQVVVLAVMLHIDVDTAPAFVVAWAAPYLISVVFAARALISLLRRSERSYRPGAAPVAMAGPPPRGAHRRDAVRGFSTRAFWRFTWPRAFASVAQLALQRVDVILLASIAGLREAAIYSVAGRFVVLGQFANQGISQAVQPRLAERLAVDDRRGANALYQIATTWLIIAAWPMYLLVSVFSGVYLQIFGHHYAAGRSVVVVLAAAMAIGSGCGMVDMVLAMAGRTSWNLINVSAALTVQMVLDLALIPHLGPLGAAIGLGTAILMNNVIPLAQIAITMGIHPFGRASLSAVLLSVGCFGLLPLCIAGAFGASVGSAAAALGAGGVLYAAGLFQLREALQLGAFIHMRRT
jgi:O-antigen/teichoic acid export membrane protein